MIGDYFSLAIGNLRHRGIRSWLTMLGIFIGIAAVVSLISLGQGLQTAVTGQFSSLSTDILTVMNAETGFGPPGSTAITKLNQHDADILNQIQGIDDVIPRLIRIVKITHNKEVKFTYVASLPEKKKEIDTIYSSFNAQSNEGRLLQEGDKGVILLGSDLAATGFSTPLKVGDSLIVQSKSFKVIGVMKKTSNLIINNAMIMPEKDLKDILNITDEFDIIAVKVTDQNQMPQIAKNIEDKFRRDRKEKVGQEDFTVQTPVQALSSVSTVLNIINIIVGGIAAISLLIGSIGIANTMYTSVLERTKEIGVMKAVGAQNKDILLIFLIESGLLGLIGGIVGVIIGLAMAFGAAAIANAAFGQSIIDVTFSWSFLISAVVFSFLIGTVAGVLPAYQASRLKPTEALRQ